MGGKDAAGVWRMTACKSAALSLVGVGRVHASVARKGHAAVVGWRGWPEQG